METVDQTVALGERVLERVFVAIDYTRSSHKALGVALDLMRSHGSAVCLFNAVESDGQDDWLGGVGSPAFEEADWAYEGEARLRRFVENVAPWAVSRVELVAKVGFPLSAMRRAARKWRATLIVASADVHARWIRSPAELLVHESEFPVLVIPSRA